jgi:hypothetical protein
VFKTETGYTFDDVFNPEKRLNVNINAKTAKKIGLIDKIIRLEPNQIAAISERFVAFADFEEAEFFEGERNHKVEAQKPEIISNNLKAKKMTKEELKAQHPDVYEAIIKEERTRVQAFLEFSDIDLEACKKHIDEGNQPDSKFYAEMTRKNMAKSALQDSKTEAVQTIKPAAETEEKSQSDAELKQAEIEAFRAAGIKVEE